MATYFLLAVMFGAWVFIQGAGLDIQALATSICYYGMVPAELTHPVLVGKVALGNGLSCQLTSAPINLLTPLFSMFLHGSWAHLLGNALFFWVFGNNIEDSMGRLRFIAFYVACGLIAAATQVFINPNSMVPMVGASGAISGVLGAYLILYPRVRVRVFMFFLIVSLPAWLVLLEWIGLQVMMGLPQLSRFNPNVATGVAVWAHIGGFVAGMVLVKFFEDRGLVRERVASGRRSRPIRW